MKTPTKQDIKGSYITPDGKAQIDFGITYQNGYPEFTACGYFEGSGGQCRDLIRDAYGSKLSCGDFHDLLYLWRDYHLKSLDGANPAVLRTLKAWASRYPFRNYYHAQADQFLQENGLKLRATLSDSKTPPWSNGGAHGHHYRVTISRPKAKTHRLHWNDGAAQGYQLVHIVGRVPSTGAEIVRNGSSRYASLETLQQVEKWNPVPRITFDFWDSVANANAGKAPTAYSVLACISSDAHTSETFEDWCSEYGESTDYLKALQTFRRCNTFAKRLRAFFTPAELEQLAEIERFDQWWDTVQPKQGLHRTESLRAWLAAKGLNL